MRPLTEMEIKEEIRKIDDALEMLLIEIENGDGTPRHHEAMTMLQENRHKFVLLLIAVKN